MENPFDKIHSKEEESKIGEKHVPVVEIKEKENETIIRIDIGSVEHPSQADHFIQWIEILDGEISLSRVYLSPMSKPKAIFAVKEKPENLIVREFCNIHGIWEYKE